MERAVILRDDSASMAVSVDVARRERSDPPAMISCVVLALTAFGVAVRVDK